MLEGSTLVGGFHKTVNSTSIGSQWHRQDSRGHHSLPPGGGGFAYHLHVHSLVHERYFTHTSIHCAHLTLLFCRCMLAPALSKSINLSLKYARYFFALILFSCGHILPAIIPEIS